MVSDSTEGEESWAQSVTNSPKIVLQLLVLQKREGFIMALQRKAQMDSRNQISDPSLIKARFIGLYYELASSMKRDLPAADYDKIVLAKDSSNTQDVIDAFMIISDWLDKKKLTRFDTLGGYDRTLVETENKHHGL